MKQLKVAGFALLALWALAGVCAAEAPAQRQIPWQVPQWTLVARGMDLCEALNSFAVAEGMAVVISPKVKGTLSGDFREVPAGEFLDRLATLHNLTWYYDGAALYIYGAGEIETILANLSYMKAEEVRQMLVELGVEDARFPIKTTQNGEIIMVSGPPRYVTLISEMIRRADRLREERTFTQVETRLFPLVNTWADSVTFSVSGPETQATIKGVAQMLEEIMGTQQEAAEQVEGAKEKGAQGEEAPKRVAGEPTFRPIIRAENRLNAVLVRDVATRMPLYEQLIRQLDVQQRLVEIGVTVLELTKDDALDWQLSLKVTGTHNNLEGGIGQSVSSLMDTATMSGRGLAGALTYLGKDVSVSASLSALRETGKARSISRTTLLTMDNMAAEMTDRQSYHARVVGTEVASLQEVSAGTTLQVKPRIVKSTLRDVPNQVWLTLELEDGGFEAITVDAMPMTRTSSVETSAVVFEGESILLGGYLRDIEEEAGWGIPYLRDIPWIGWLFGGASHQKQTIQRMFILTPYIIDLNADSLARIQAARQRDILYEDVLEDDAEQSDAERKRREAARKDLRERREAYNQERLRREKAERALRKEIREDILEDDAAQWDAFFQEIEQDYEAWKAKQETLRKARDQQLEAEQPTEAQAPVEPPTPAEDEPQVPELAPDPEADRPAEPPAVPGPEPESANLWADRVTADAAAQSAVQTE
ncbi:MAG: type III secretion system outer membrane ring subunit SctC [Candidatus Spyradenecus sp.]